MNDLRDRIAQALLAREVPEEHQPRLAPGELSAHKAEAAKRADAVMPIVAGLAADLQHAERENRRLTEELKRLKGAS